MATQTTAVINNPVTGPFGTGQVQWFLSSGSWTVPPGIGKVRVRLWGGGGGGNAGASLSGNVNYVSGAGGGFALKTIYDLSGVTSIPVTVGIPATTGAITSGSTTGGTSSFGSYVSATGGSYTAIDTKISFGGYGVGGDINTFGGNGYNVSTAANAGGGGSGSIFGNGGNGGAGGAGFSALGGAGGGAGGSSTTGGNGFLGNGGLSATVPATSILVTSFSIDFIGTGGGGYSGYPGNNGGGAGYSYTGSNSLPASGTSANGGIGGNGLVIVEW